MRGYIYLEVRGLYLGKLELSIESLRELGRMKWRIVQTFENGCLLMRYRW